MEKDFVFEDVKSCPVKFVLAINDTLNVLTGKWKFPIIGALLFSKMRFKEIQMTIPTITPRMLSRELKELELNGVLRRNVYNTRPVTIEYELTDSGIALKDVFENMVEWGLEHRKSVFSKK